MASPSNTETSEEQNTDDERCNDGIDSTDDDVIIDDECMDEQYAILSSFEVTIWIQRLLNE